MAGIMESFKNIFNPPEDEYDEYDDYDEAQDEEEPAPAPAPRARAEAAPRAPQPAQRRTADGKVVNLNSSAQLQVVISKPEHFGEETCAVADELLRTNTVVLNLEERNKDVARRIVDFLSGVTYATGGKIKRVAANTFIITPYNVELSGEAENAIDEMSDEELEY